MRHTESMINKDGREARERMDSQSKEFNLWKTQYEQNKDKIDPVLTEVGLKQA